MTVLWRISRHKDLKGTGGLRAPGRWHHAGFPVVYLAGSPSAALLEVCVHTSANDIPPAFTLLKISGPTVRTPSIDQRALPRDWALREEVTRAMGTDWLRKKSSPLLKIPSALVPETFNFLFNPLHPDSGEFRIEDSFSYPFDARLKR